MIERSFIVAIIVLKYTDPSGYFFSGLKKWVSKHWKAIVTTVATVAVGFLTAEASS